MNGEGLKSALSDEGIQSYVVSYHQQVEGPRAISLTSIDQLLVLLTAPQLVREDGIADRFDISTDLCVTHVSQHSIPRDLACLYSPLPECIATPHTLAVLQLSLPSQPRLGEDLALTCDPLPIVQQHGGVSPEIPP